VIVCHAAGNADAVLHAWNIALRAAAGAAMIVLADQVACQGPMPNLRLPPQTILHHLLDAVIMVDA
jgi:hypothetical protein